jgi:hypothetical protein
MKTIDYAEAVGTFVMNEKYLMDIDKLIFRSLGNAEWFK